MALFSFKHRDGRILSVEIPTECPICHRLIVISGPETWNNSVDNLFESIYQCTNPDCERLFLCFYSIDSVGNTKITRLFPTYPKEKELPEVIKNISPQFIEIYLQAQEAKDNGLAQICGPGFRKAFEFLIKDYAKSKEPDEAKQKAIENTLAGNVVNQYIDDKRIQSVAKRALWIGNDETHYLRKWETKDIDDLIALIQLTIHWIEIEHLSSKYTSEMPE